MKKTKLNSKFSLRAVAAATMVSVSLALAPTPSYAVSGNIIYILEQIIVDALKAAKEWYDTMMKLTAERIAALQEALGAQVRSQTTVEAAKMGAEAEAAIAAQERVTEATVAFGNSTGQGFDPCGNIKNASAIGTMRQELPQMAAQRARRTPGGPGKVAPRGEAEGEMTARINNKSECPDVFSFDFLKPDSQQSTTASCRELFTDLASGLPHIPLNNPGNPDAKHAMLEQLKLDARKSTAIASLTALEAELTGDAGGDASDPKGKSMYERLETEALRYAGAGEDADKWVKTMASQHERGLLVELLRAKALNLAIMERQYHIYDRIVANLAAELAQRTEGQNIEVAAILAKAKLSGVKAP